MDNPLTLVPFALAATGARFDGVSAEALTSAGVSLLRRCAPLVRQLLTGRPALLLPRGAPFVTALAACDGHVAMLLDPTLGDIGRETELKHQLTAADVGVVFTLASLATALPASLPRVLLDGAPTSAEYADGSRRITVDLGTHVGLSLEGREDEPGRDTPVLAWMVNDVLHEFSHAEVMAGAAPLWLGPLFVRPRA